MIACRSHLKRDHLQSHRSFSIIIATHSSNPSFITIHSLFVSIFRTSSEHLYKATQLRIEINSFLIYPKANLVKVQRDSTWFDDSKPKKIIYLQITHRLIHHLIHLVESEFQHIHLLHCSALLKRPLPVLSTHATLIESLKVKLNFGFILF